MFGAKCIPNAKTYILLNASQKKKMRRNNLFLGPPERATSSVYDGLGFGPIMILHLDFVLSRWGSVIFDVINGTRVKTIG
jgi:hypothetical protein